MALSMANTLVKRALGALIRPNRAGHVAAVVGGTRGLGLDLAREFSRLGYRVALCARDPDEVARAHTELAAGGADVLARVYDAALPEDMARFVGEVVAHFGALDVLATCAATIQVGPLEAMTQRDFEDSLTQIFWTTYHPTMAALPVMRRQKRGHIAHVTSFGGKVSVPHLLPYCTAKFAATGFSEGLRAAVAHEGIRVTTITPGIMRTGAHVNAPFKGEHEREYSWFATGATLPFVSLASETAARRIVRAVERGAAECTLAASIRWLVIANTLSPSLTSRALTLANMLLPGASGATTAERGADVAARSSSRWVRTLDSIGRPNAERHHAYPGPVNLSLEERGLSRPPHARA
jgi:NAD(P)-dependent dehydrogenase (short-subunit alcohol dehydrogenase family)